MAMDWFADNGAPNAADGYKWNEGNVFDVGWDLNPLANDVGGGADGVRDRLAANRNTFLQPLMKQYRDAVGAGNSNDDDEGLYNDESFRNFARTGALPDKPYAADPTRTLGAFTPGAMDGGAIGNYKPFDETFSGPEMPADLSEKWDKTFQWDPSKALEDPALQARMDKIQKGRERYAASRGTLLTGGTTAALDRELVGEALQGQDADFSRAMSAYKTDYDTFTGDKDRRLGVFQTGYGNARNAFLDRAGIHQANESGRVGVEGANANIGLAAKDQAFNQGRATKLDAWGRDDSLYGRSYAADRDNVSDLFRLTDYGYGAANNLGAFATGYGRSAGDTAEGIGNANAAGQVGSANAWTNGVNGAVNGTLGAWGAMRRPTAQPDAQYWPLG